MSTLTASEKFYLIFFLVPSYLMNFLFAKNVKFGSYFRCAQNDYRSANVFCIQTATR